MRFIKDTHEKKKPDLKLEILTHILQGLSRFDNFIFNSRKTIIGDVLLAKLFIVIHHCNFQHMAFNKELLSKVLSF